MDGKFLQIWPLRSVTKVMAVLMMIVLAVAIYATREIPDNFADNKEWEFWRNLDFAVCVVSLAFASVLFYGSITEFTMFVLAWMMWNVILTAFWIVFLALKYDELVEWEKNFRAFAISLMIFAEFPAFSYFRYLRAKHKDSESNFSWMENQSDKVYKTLSERPSFSSFNSIFANTSGVKNSGFQSHSARSSVVSEASEEIEKTSEEKVDTEDKNDIMETENEKMEEKEDGKDGKEDKSDVQSQSSFEISVTVHGTKPETPPSAIKAVESAGQEKTSTDLEHDQATQITVEKQKVPGYISSIEVELSGVKGSLHLESSVDGEIDVTETGSKDFYQTSF